MKTIQEMLEELSQCIVTVSGEFRIRTNWKGGKVPQPDLDVFDPNVPFCIENVGDVPASVQYNTENTNIRISKNYKTWNDYTSGTEIELNPTERVYIKSDYVKDLGFNPRFVFNGDGARLRARGNIASLIYGSNDAYVNKYTSTKTFCYQCMFDGCTSLVQAPVLPAIELDYTCYSRMFRGCTSLTQAPELPSIYVVIDCYNSMFQGCTSLTQAPELPATILEERCYESMFDGCTSLTQAPELPAMTLAPSCYSSMFNGCTSLVQAPELPATTLANSCYSAMFGHCTSLTQAPVLPATTLAEWCYSSMFSDCTSLTQAPELPATTLADYCYWFMFSSCTKLNYVKCLATDTSATDCTKNWLSNVASKGTFECDNKKYFTIDSPNGIPVGWTITEINPAQPEPEKPDLDVFDPNVPFCIENVGDVKASVKYNTRNSNIRISKDYKTWNDYTTGDSITLDPTERVYIKSDYAGYVQSNPSFVFNGYGARLRARGNIASLIYGTNDAYVSKYTSTEEYCYYRMFWDCTSLTQAPELPATTLAYSCYGVMFSGCTSLTQAPKLPATKLVNDCYLSMFGRCTSLTQAPELPATTLALKCYKSMFNGCTSLTQAPELPATTLAERCYDSMFNDCTSLTQAPELPATTLAPQCYYTMFSGCTSLTQAPELPATTLADYCYWCMFGDCTSLTQAPELPATTLAYSCYAAMFSGCTKLNYVKCLATDTSAVSCTENWLSNVAQTGTFECENKKYFTIDSSSGIPRGWTIIEKPNLDKFDPNVPFCIENVGDAEAKVQYTTNNTNIKISSDNNTWNDYVSGTEITLNPSGRLYIKSDYSKVDLTGKQFTITGSRVRARGNIASLIYGSNDEYVSKYTRTEIQCYANLFEDCTNLVTAPDLPATSLTRGCYQSMFKGCNSLAVAPELPATSIEWWSYYRMFEGCANLAQAPELPATSLQTECYAYMFSHCDKLLRAPSLPAARMTLGCYKSMFENCTGLETAPALTSTFLAEECYAYMFSGCASLTSNQKLPATQLYPVCYTYMFRNCDKLQQIECYATDISARDCTKGWLEGVSSTGDFYTKKDTAWSTGVNGIPQGWTRHDV